MEYSRNTPDKIVGALLISSSDSNFVYQRKDGTLYMCEERNDKEDYYYEIDVNPYVQ